MMRAIVALLCLSVPRAPGLAVLPVAPRLKRISPIERRPPWLWSLEMDLDL